MCVICDNTVFVIIAVKACCEFLQVKNKPVRLKMESALLDHIWKPGDLLDKCNLLRKLKQREMRLRDWEARLMDMQAEIRESSPPPKTQKPEAEAEPKPAPEPVREPPPRTSSFKIEISSGDGGWALVDEDEQEQ